VLRGERGVVAFELSVGIREPVHRLHVAEVASLAG
jgi:hypothetical protein